MIKCFICEPINYRNLLFCKHSVPIVYDSVLSGLRENKDAAGVHQVESTQRHSCEQVVHVEGLSMEIVIAIAFAAFIIGILLMASLWYIYVHTGKWAARLTPLKLPNTL